jgi:hypothetical protein
MSQTIDLTLDGLSCGQKMVASVANQLGYNVFKG